MVISFPFCNSARMEGIFPGLDVHHQTESNDVVYSADWKGVRVGDRERVARRDGAGTGRTGTGDWPSHTHRLILRNV